MSAHPLAFAELALEREHRLPEDHPRWPTDAISLGSRARALLAKLRPLAIRIMTFWDHHVRACTIGGRRLGIDATGSYRLE
ncbi:MAG: hypothetical protein JO101_10750 [Candidatus Eremiobacteraeota bacterium]|nr:hypothetical protein [Candidatus Eremiobacteraeota bacterium]